MKTINYSIQIYTYWHCGSGLAAGADVDLLPVKNKKGLPYVPGKTIKGLVREAAETICSLQNLDIDLNECFGFLTMQKKNARGRHFSPMPNLVSWTAIILSTTMRKNIYTNRWPRLLLI